MDHTGGGAAARNVTVIDGLHSVLVLPPSLLNANVIMPHGLPGSGGSTGGPGANGGGIHSAASIPDEYDRFVADVWVCVALTLMILSCIGLLCSCMLYHKLQQWKHHVERSSVVNGDGDSDSLPSYTLVTGLPTYEQALAIMEEGKAPLQSTTVEMIVSKESTSPTMPPSTSSLETTEIVENLKETIARDKR